MTIKSAPNAEVKARILRSSALEREATQGRYEGVCFPDLAKAGLEGRSNRQKFYLCTAGCFSAGR